MVTQALIALDGHQHLLRHHRPATLVAVDTEAELVRWIVQHANDVHKPLPGQDYLAKNSKYALLARQELGKLGPAGQVPDDLFLREVLPYQQVDEPIDDFRAFFFESLSHLVRNSTTLREVADQVVPAAFVSLGKKLEFKANSTPEVMAPVSETLAKGYASCTGLSIFVADVLRSVGVPARVVGTPEWNLTTGGNHNWVEAWLGDGWHYMDAVPTEKVEWDNAWFTSKNTQLAEEGTIHGIYAPSWAKEDANGNYSLTWRTPPVQLPALDRTVAYKFLVQNSTWDPKWDQYRKASEDTR